MAGGVPARRILGRTEHALSPWVRIIGKRVEALAGGSEETYHCLRQPDAIAILARTAKGLIPVVEQYRPAVESVTWELPSGLLDPGEDPAEACRRELWEETGLRARSVRHVGSYYADTGRMEHLIHAFYVTAAGPDSAFTSEPGLKARFVTPAQLRRAITTNRFGYLHHIAVLQLARWKGCRWDAAPHAHV